MSMPRRAFLAFMASVPVAQWALSAEPLQPWEEAVYADVRQRYGEEAEQRMRRVFEIMASNVNESNAAKLRIANDTMNRLPWIADRAKYSSADYWATPLETIATFGGDCEDIAIAKFVMLRGMRIPAENLRLGYVKIRATGEAHLVLLYDEQPDAAPGTSQVHVLDQLEPEVLPAEQRRDLVAVFTIDAEKHVRVILDNGGARTLVSEAENTKFSKLDKIRQQIAENSVYYRRLNGDRPLF